jgi:uncharacterized repeat protein (TIGR01451 family)
MLAGTPNLQGVAMHSIRSARRSAAAIALGLVIALTPLGVVGAGEPSTTADLALRIVDRPDPVVEGNDVAYIARVKNLGPDTATNVELDEYLPAGTTLVSAEGDGFDCGGVTVLGKGADVVCTAAAIAPGATASATFVVRTSSLSDGSTTITDVVNVFSDNDPNLDNNSKQENTLVVGSNADHTSGYIPPQGGQLTTDVGPPGPDASDTTVLRMRVAGGGPGGRASLDEEACRPPFAPCIDKIGVFRPPPGYTTDVARIIAVFLIDASKDPGVPKRKIQVGFRKRRTDPVVNLPRCGDAPVAPCILQIKRVPQGWLRVRLLIESDPKFSPR